MAGVTIRPISPQRLVALLAGRIESELAETVPSATALAGTGPGRQGGRLRIGLDGAPGSGASSIAAALAEAIRGGGRPVIVVNADDFWRPASLRLERGRANPDAFYEDWYDLAALAREVLDPLRPGGTCQVLPSLWDPVTDRATRAPYQDLPPGGVLVLHGPLLLGAGLDFELTVHFVLSSAALVRRLPAELAWTQPAYQRYHDEVAPHALADLVVRSDDPRHPALLHPA
jgi:hypothetical protein